MLLAFFKYAALIPWWSEGSTFFKGDYIMKKIIFVTSLAAALMASACETTPETNTAEPAVVAEAAPVSTTSSKTSSEKSTSVKGLSQVFSAPVEDVRVATLAAMKKYGFEMKDESGNEFKAKRSNKVGLVVGSGGERMLASVNPLDDGTVEVRVQTKKTFVGIAGQKNWDDEVMDAIKESLL